MMMTKLQNMRKIMFKKNNTQNSKTNNKLYDSHSENENESNTKKKPSI